MGVFKNDIGRPSNNTKKIRLIIKIIILFLILFFVCALIYKLFYVSGNEMKKNGEIQTNKIIVQRTTNNNGKKTTKKNSKTTKKSLKTTTKKTNTSEIKTTTKKVENKTTTTIKTTSRENNLSDNRIYFLSMQRGNATLLRIKDGSSYKYGLIDAGRSTNISTCDTLLSELSSIMVNSKLEFIIISHMHADHAGCASDVIGKFSNSNTDVYMKHYSDNINNSDNSITRYNNIKNASKNVGARLNLFKNDKYYTSDNYTSNIGKNNNIYVVSNKASINNKLTLYNRDDWNKNYATVKFGNFSINLLNLVQRRISDKNNKINNNAVENQNSIVVYAEYKIGTKKYSIYLPGDLENKTYAGNKTFSYNINNTIADKSNKNYDWADFYAAYVSGAYLKNKKLDIYESAHHNTPVGTDVYISNKLIDKNTKIIASFAYNNFIENYTVDTVKSSGKSCSEYTEDSAKKFRCLNDYTVYNILEGTGLKNIKIYYIENIFDSNGAKKNGGGVKADSTLKFGLRNDTITSNDGSVINYKIQGNKLISNKLN